MQQDLSTLDRATTRVRRRGEGAVIPGHGAGRAAVLARRHATLSTEIVGRRGDTRHHVAGHGLAPVAVANDHLSPPPAQALPVDRLAARTPALPFRRSSGQETPCGN